MSNSASRPSKNERRDAAREKARALREQQKKREKRNRLFLIGGISVGSLAILGVIALIIFTSIRPAGPGPANMATDGIKFGTDLVAEAAPARAADAPPQEPVEPAEGVVDIRVWVDYLCPICGAFEATNAEQIQGWVEDGSATLEIHPIAILDRASQGSRYSTRSANAAACVANYAPESAYDYSAALFVNQPAENTAGLDDQTLVDLATEAGATGAEIETCIVEGEFENWVSSATNAVLTGPIPDSDVEAVQGTPTVIVNGVKYNGPVDSAEDFAAFVLAQTATGSTPAPTPTPSPSVTP